MKSNKCLLMLTGLLVSGSTFAQQDTSFSGLFNAVKAETEPARMEALVITMERVATREHAPNTAELLTYSQAHLVETFAHVGNFAKANSWRDKMAAGRWKDDALLQIAAALTEQNKLAEAEKLVKPYAEGKVAASNGSGQFATDYTPYFVTQYGVILYKKGAYKEAAAKLAGARKTEQREMYALALMATGDKEQAMTETNKLLLLPGERSKDFLAGVKKLYGNDARFQQVLDSAVAVKQKRIVEKMSKMKVDQPAPDFHLTNVNGKSVSLASLRGKTVILDFWATWCIPCVGSFPGMQRAVDYYAKDTNVVFMFIHTSERSKTATDEAKRLLSNKHYRFDLYMDLTNETSGKNEVTEAFNVELLPTKFVIDKNGIIRFKNTGFVSEHEAVPEIKAMVDMVNGKTGW